MRNCAAEKLLSTARTEGLSITESSFAEFMDNIDPLHEHRDSFIFPKKRDGTEFIYVSGNLLGLQHKNVESSVNVALRKWRDISVFSDFQQSNPLFELNNLGRKEMATIVGAQESEVVTMNSGTVNLHLLLMAFYNPRGKRRKIMTENHSFPANTHALISQLETRGMNPSEDIIFVGAQNHEDWESSPVIIPIEQFLSVIDKCGDEIAVIMMSVLNFITGQLFDIQTITKAAHEKSILVGVDCSQAVGNVPLNLHDWDVDFAFWCTYRYLNSGPGNLGGAFVHHKHTLVGNKLRPLRGWWGHDRRGRLSLHHNFEPAEGAAAFQLSNVPIMGMMTMLPSVSLFGEIGISPLREKSMLLTSYMELLLSELLPPGAIEVITPVDPNQRGAQLSIRILSNKLRSDFLQNSSYDCSFSEDTVASHVKHELCEKGVIVSHFQPDIIFLTPVPLYNSFMDVLLTVRALAECF